MYPVALLCPNSQASPFQCKRIQKRETIPVPENQTFCSSLRHECTAMHYARCTFDQLAALSCSAVCMSLSCTCRYHTTSHRNYTMYDIPAGAFVLLSTRVAEKSKYTNGNNFSWRSLQEIIVTVFRKFLSLG